MSKENLETYLDHQTRKVKDNVEIVDVKTTKHPVLLHMSKDSKIKEFVPFVSGRTMKTEDRTVPRVSTSTHVYGCFYGYAGAIFDFIDGPTNINDPGFDGGWYFYSMDYKLALKPNKELVPDVEMSSEVWLVPYKDSNQYSANIIARVIPVSVVTEWKFHKNVRYQTNFYTMQIEVTSREIMLTEDISVKKGYWEFIMETNRDYIKERVFNVNKISKSDFNKNKKEKTTMETLRSLTW